MSFITRYANENDTSVILKIVKGLVEFENMGDQVTAKEGKNHGSRTISIQYTKTAGGL
ncbi:MAG: hypothetical protein ACYDG2_03025 [Ruminiclostridium sp.]